jgi:hypothetical protein
MVVSRAGEWSEKSMTASNPWSQASADVTAASISRCTATLGA